MSCTNQKNAPIDTDKTQQDIPNQPTDKTLPPPESGSIGGPTPSNSDPDLTTTGETVLGSDTDLTDGDGFAVTSGELAVSFIASKPVVQRIIDPTSTLTWSTTTGQVDAVDIIANVRYLQRDADINGSLEVSPEVPTLYQAIFKYRGEIVSTREVTVHVLGTDESDSTLGAFLDIHITPTRAKSDWSTGYIADQEIVVQYVANKVVEIEFEYPENCNAVCRNPGQKTVTDLSGEFSFLPLRTGVIKATVTTEDGDHFVVEKEITLDEGIPEAHMEVIGYEDHLEAEYRGLTRFRMRFKNIMKARLQYYNATTEEWDTIHAVPIPLLRSSEGPYATDIFYGSQDCGPGLCHFRLLATPFHGDPIMLEESTPSLSSGLHPTKAQAKLANGNWRKIQVEWEFEPHLFTEVHVLNECNPEASGFSGFVIWNVCKHGVNTILFKYKTVTSPIWHLLRKTVVVSSPSAILEDKTAYSTRSLRDSYNPDEKYDLEAKFSWATSAALHIKRPEAITDPETGEESDICRIVPIDLDAGDFQIRPSTPGPSGLTVVGGSTQVQRLLQFPIDENCYLFELVVQGLGDEERHVTITATPKVALTYERDDWNAHSTYYPEVDSRILGIRVFYDPAFCTLTDYRMRMNVLLKNAHRDPWTEGESGLFECPNTPGLPVTKYNSAGVLTKPRDIPENSGITPMNPPGTHHIEAGYLLDERHLGEVWRDGYIGYLDGRVRTTQVIHHYYYNSTRPYGCRMCTLDRGGRKICTQPQLFENSPPSVHGVNPIECSAAQLSPWVQYPLLNITGGPEDPAGSIIYDLERTWNVSGY